ncbi:MAG: glycosyltransferase [Parcubacteria group bacterium]|nr:glycosyltransferase [Parcubacteria group bacterium]
MTVRVVLPAYNEAQSLRILLPDLIKSLTREGKKFRIYVVDDGSSDNTTGQVKKISSNKVTLIRHVRNLGLSEAINSGLRRALKDSRDDDIIVTMDADNSHLPGLINRMVRLIEEGHDIVISSRFVSGARVRGVPLARRILSFGASILFKLLFPIQGVRDYTCGFRAYRVSLLKLAVEKFGNNFINQKGFSCMVDILLKLREFDPIITEVPMILRYDLKPGKSKMDVGKTLIETLNLIVKRSLLAAARRLLNINHMKRFSIWFLLIAIFLASRFYNLEGLPLFSDEGYAVARAWELKNTGELLGMVKYTTQPIFIWILSLFRYLPFNDVVNGRLVSGISGLGTALILAKLAGKWIGRGADIPAFMLMTVLPFSVFYDRTILFESTTLFFMVLALVFPAATGLAVLTKQTGWLVLPLVAVIGQGDLRKRWLKIGAGILTAIAVWYLVMGNLDLVLGTVLAKTAAPISASADFKSNFLRSKLWLEDYLTWPVIWMSILGGAAALVEALRRKKITPLLVIATWTLGIFLFINKTAVIFYPRYLYPMVLGVVLLVTREWFEFGKRLGLKGWILVGLVMLAPGMVRSGMIVLTPESAKIPREDRFQFFEDWTSGVGSEEIADKIAEINSGKEVEVYLEEENSYFITLKSDPRLKRVNIETAGWLVDPLTEVPKKVLSEGKISMFVRNRHPDIPDDWPVELVLEVPKTASRSVYLYRIIK